MNNQEKRFLNSNFEVRSNDGKTVVEGYAARFDDETTIGGQFAEKVARGAFDGTDMSNTVALFNHDWNMPLARIGKGLSLEVDEVGLRYSFELGEQSYAKDLAENIRMGNVSTSSFGFTVEGDDWERRDGGMHLRTITSVGTLFDVSPTTQGAYPTTEVALRSMEAALNVEIPVEMAEAPVEAPVEDVLAEEAPEVIEEEILVEEEPEEAPAEEEPEEEPAEEEEKENNPNEPQETEARNFTNNSKMENNLNAAPAVAQSLGDAEARAAKSFDFGKFVKEAASGKLTGVEAEMAQEGRSQFKGAGVSTSGGFDIPDFVVRSMGTAAIGSGSTASGTGIGVDDAGITAKYAPNDIASRMGLRNLSNLNGDVSMQVQSTLTSAALTGEGVLRAEALPAFSEVTLSPNRYAAHVGVTQQMLAQSGADMSAFIQMDIQRALDKVFNAAVISAIDAVDTSSAYNATTYNPLDMEELLLAADVDLNNIQFLTSAGAFRTFRSLSLDAGSGNLFANSPNGRRSVIGYDAEISSQVSNGVAFAFDKSQVVTGQWGGLNLIVDPYTDAHKGVVRLIANTYRDVATLQSAGIIGISAA
jgi:uncharacterized protein